MAAAHCSQCGERFYRDGLRSADFCAACKFSNLCPRCVQRHEGAGNELDHSLYPVTQHADWGPLTIVAPDLVGEFMFMQADSHGRRYYKNKTTRRYIVLDAKGTAYDRGGSEMPIAHALAACLPQPDHWEAL